MTPFSPTSPLDLASEPTPTRRPAIAATVDAGLAGLLSAVLANQRGISDHSAEVAVEHAAVEDLDTFMSDRHETAEEEDEGLFTSDAALTDETDDTDDTDDEEEPTTFSPVDEGSLFDEVDEHALFDEVDEHGLFDEDESEHGLFDEVDEVDEVHQVDEDSADGLDEFDTPVWFSPVAPAARADTTVAHLVVHHVVEHSTPHHDDRDAVTTALKAARFGPTAGFQSAAASAAGTTVQLLRHATDSTDNSETIKTIETAADSDIYSSSAIFTPDLLTAQVAAELAASAGPDFTNNPVFRHGVMPTRQSEPPVPVVKPAPVARILSPLQVNLLIEGLAQVRARPGEEGLPPGVLLMDVRGPLGRYQNDSLYTIRSQIDGAVRGGDMALVVPDLGILLFCGGLFFPGDLEVMGSRLRRRALDANPSVSPADALKVTVAGALAVLGEDPVDFVKRAVAAFDESIHDSREDIVVDYADPRRPRG